MSPLSLLTLTTAIFGFLVSCILVFSVKYNRFASRFLGIGFFVLSYRTLTIYLLKEQLVPDTFLLGSVSFLYYSGLPMIYLYIRILVNDEQSLRKKDYLHFILPLAAFFLALFYVIKNYIVTGRLGLPIQRITWQAREGSWQVPAIYHALLLFSIGVFYAIACWRTFYLKLLKTPPLHPHAKQIRNWVLLLIIPLSLLLPAVFFGNIIGFFSPFTSYDEMLWIRSLLLIFIFSRVLLNARILYGLPDIQTALPVIADSIEKDSPGAGGDETCVLPSEPTLPEEPVERRQEEIYYDASGWVHLHCLEKQLVGNTGPAPVEKDKAAVYIQRINNYLEEHPFTMPDFSMQTMGRALGIPVHHLEYLFRYYNKYSFVEFRNTQRVHYLLTSFMQQRWKNYTLEAIGEEAGFSSRTTFFRVFKQVTGKSPKSYLDTLQQVGYMDLSSAETTLS